MSTQPEAAGTTAVITERRASAPPEVQQARAEAVRNLDGLGLINAGQGQMPADVLTGYDITIDGVTLPVAALGYELVSTAEGHQLTVVFPVDQVTVGGATTHTPGRKQTAGRPAGPVRVWEPATRDPRENIPDWSPTEAPEVSSRD